jgi:two-component system chemotaxis response regulator CheB
LAAGTQEDLVNKRDIIVIAASSGGLTALKTLLSAWSPDLRASVFIVMHIGAQPSVLPEILGKDCALPVKHAEDGEPIKQAVVYIAPPDKHILLQDGTIHLSSAPKENFVRPAADPLFRSAAINYGSRVVGVVLTGELDDGAAGLRSVRACGGAAAIQEPTECPAPSMPINALRAVPDAMVAPITQLGDTVARLLDESVPHKAPQDAAIRRTAEIETRIALTGRSDPSDLRAIGTLSDLTCPDCGGVIWKIGSEMPLRYRCHTGHAFSAVSLEDRQRQQSEDALWSVVRGIQERISLAKQLLAGSEPDQLAELTAKLQRLEDAEETVQNLLKKPPVTQTDQ